MGTALAGSLGVTRFTPIGLAYIAKALKASAALGRDVAPADPRSFEPDADGVALMQAQRARVHFAGPTGRQIAVVGGEIEQAVVSREGVAVFSLDPRDDRIGKAI